MVEFMLQILVDEETMILYYLIDLFSDLLVSDVRINLNVVLLFLFFGCRMLFGNENMLVEIICIGDRFVVAFVFFRH